jgi:hypothetical protein
MVRSQTACELARKLPDVSEKDHFGGDAFYANKRIFATVWHEKKQVNLRFSPELQREFLATDGEAFTEIDNAWGRQGWTTAQLEFIDRPLLEKALQAAWEQAGVKKKRPPKKAIAKSKKNSARKKPR